MTLSGLPEKLHSSGMKLQRAKVHINALDRSIKRWFDTHPGIITTRQLDVQGVGQIHRVDPSTPTRWGLIAGDALTNFRASLDHIAWVLALKVGTPERPRRVQFPIFDCQKRYDDPSYGAARMLGEVWPDSHHIFERLQPYHSAEWPETDYLRVLDTLVNLDKHRILTQTVLTASAGPAYILDPRSNPPRSHVFRNPFEMIVTRRVLEALKKQNLQMKLTVDVAFSAEGTAVDGYSIHYLTLIHDFIRDEVIPRFAGFFE